MRVKTPNTVIVFSNSTPMAEQLSKDRWRIYEIMDDRLCKSTKNPGLPYYTTEPAYKTEVQKSTKKRKAATDNKSIKKQKTHHMTSSEAEREYDFNYEPEPDSDDMKSEDESEHCEN